MAVSSPFNIGLLLFPHLTQLDLIGRGKSLLACQA